MSLSRIFVAPKNGQGGVKKSFFFFRKNIRKMGKKNWGPLGPYLQKIDFLKSGSQGGSFPRLLPLQRYCGVALAMVSEVRNVGRSSCLQVSLYFNTLLGGG